MATERFIVVTQNGISVEDGIFYSREDANSLAQKLVAEYGLDHQVYEIRLSYGENFKYKQVVEVEKDPKLEKTEEEKTMRDKYIVCDDFGDSVENGIYKARADANKRAQELADDSGDDHKVFEITVGYGENFKPHIEESEEGKNNDC